jgi:hypothetical protein
VYDTTLPAGLVQQPDSGLLIASGGERVTLRQVAEYADIPTSVKTCVVEAQLDARFGALPADQAARHWASAVSGTPEHLIELRR